MKLGCDRIPVCGRSFFGAIGQLRVARCEIFVTECERDHTWKGKVMHLRMTGGPLRSSDPSQENRHENTSHCCRFWSRCGVARFCPARQRTPSPAKVQLVAVECPPAMGAQQPKQFRKSKLRGISAVGELISGRDSKAFQMVGDQVANLGPTTMRSKGLGSILRNRGKTDRPACSWTSGPRQGTRRERTPAKRGTPVETLLSACSCTWAR